MRSVRWLAAITAIVLMSCRVTEPAALGMVMTVEPAMLSLTDSAAVVLQITNRSSRTVRATSPDSYGFCFHAFQVFDESQREVSVATGFCVALVGPSPIDLAPGASITVRDWWRPDESSLGGQPLPAGAYRLIGRYHGDDRDILSAPAEVTLLP